MTKKLFAAILALALLYGTAGATDYTYNGKDGLDWDNAYIINTAEDMNALQEHAGNGKFYKLNADITLTSKPNWASRTFNGYLDGQNHTIDYSSVLEMPALFYEVSVPEHAENPAIQKLKVKGSISTSQYSYAGGIVRYLGSGIIDSCTFTGTIRTTLDCAGGIVGYMKGGTIKNCTVSGTFRASNRIGGIVGHMSGNTENTVEKCTVLSGTKLSASGSSSTRTGGIVGYMQRGKITDCTSYAALSDAEYKGGILGYLSNDDQVNNITNNKYANADKVIGNRNDSGVGNTKIDGNSAPEQDTGTNTGTDTGNETDSDNGTGSGTGTGEGNGNGTGTGGGEGNGNGTGTDTSNGDGTEGKGDSQDGDTSEDSGSDDSSGCNAGFSVLMLAGVIAVKFRKH